MLGRQNPGYILFSVFLDSLATVLALFLSQYLRNTLNIGRVLGETERFPLLLSVGVLGIWLVVFVAFSVYDPQRTYKFRHELRRVTFASVLVLLILAGTLYFTHRELSRLLIVYFFVLQLGMLLAWRMIVRALRRQVVGKRRTAHRIIVIGDSELAETLASAVIQYRWIGLEIVGFIGEAATGQIMGKPILGSLPQAREIIAQQAVDEVIIALPSHAYTTLQDLVVSLQTLPINLHIVPDYLKLVLYRAAVEDLGGVPLIHLRHPALSPYQRLIKRAFDLLITMIMIPLTLPLMALIAFAVKLGSPGTILFSQQRVGENGRLFTMLKFRTMQMQVNPSRPLPPGVDHKVSDDPRITRLGRFLRQTSLDELPQLFNVLKGDMSLVGPRPELPWLVDLYEPWQRKRFAVPQGMTGWWQVNSRHWGQMHQHTEDDLYYIQNYSLGLDIQIMLKTVWAMVRRQGI
jgi:exopolysaccharide biosynthesis polyprenyl glycosylphosphotransferase